jgi:hypothetical protein
MTLKRKKISVIAAKTVTKDCSRRLPITISIGISINYAGKTGG